MSDASFAGLMVVATCLYVRGLCGDREAAGLVVAGSAVAAAAFLFRQQGALIPARSSPSCCSPAGPGSTGAACAPSPG